MNYTQIITAKQIKHRVYNTSKNTLVTGYSNIFRSMTLKHASSCNVPSRVFVLNECERGEITPPPPPADSMMSK